MLKQFIIQFDVIPVLPGGHNSHEAYTVKFIRFVCILFELVHPVATFSLTGRAIVRKSFGIVVQADTQTQSSIDISKRDNKCATQRDEMNGMQLFLVLAGPQSTQSHR